MSQKYRVFVTLIKLTTSTFNHKNLGKGRLGAAKVFL